MKKLLFTTTLFCITLTNFAQDTITYSNVQDLDLVMANIFGIQCAGVSNLSQQANPISIGRFETGDSVGVHSGVVLSTGAIYQSGQASGNQNSVNLNMPGDADIDYFGMLQGFNYPSFDATIIEFDFTPSITDTIRFNYIFASEEYPEYVYQNFTDRFLFLVSEDGGAYENIAKIPNTSTTVEINTINQYQNTNLYVDNSFGSTSGNFVFDGYTVPLEAKFFAEIGVSYHIKLVISDINDALYDSAIFLEEQSSFNNISGNLQVDGQPAEGTVEIFNYVQSNVGLAEPVYTANVSNGILDADSLTTGLYHVRFTPDPIAFPNAAPTYFINGELWADADAIGLPCFYDPANISSPVLTVPAGNGSIAGSVSIDTSYTKTSLEMMENALIKLFNNADQLIGFTYTDSDGEYSFDNLAIGTYHMKLDVPYIPQLDSHNIEITSDEDFLGADFEISNDLINPINNLTLGIYSNDLGGISVYPNPASDYLNIESNSNTSYQIFNTEGKLIQSGGITTGLTTLSLSDMEKGLYYLSFNNHHYQKLVIK
jgi:hypothetical protein